MNEDSRKFYFEYKLPLPAKLKQLMVDQCSLDTDVVYKAKKDLAKALYGEVRYSRELLPDVTERPNVILNTKWNSLETQNGVCIDEQGRRYKFDKLNELFMIDNIEHWAMPIGNNHVVITTNERVIEINHLSRLYINRPKGFYVSQEALDGIRTWDKSIDNDVVPVVLSQGFVINSVTHDKYAKCLLNLNEINSVPAVHKKCVCDLITVLMVTGCVCGGE